MVTTSISDTIILTTSSFNRNVVTVSSSTSGDNSAIMSLTLMISTFTHVTSVMTIDSYNSSDIVTLATSTPVVANSVISMMSTSVYVAADTQSGSDSNDIPLGIIAGCVIVVVLCIILLLVVILLWCYLRRRKVALDLPQADGN